MSSAKPPLRLLHSRTIESPGPKKIALLPTGTVTFLFTDIEGSTALWQQHPAAMPDTIARHHAILRQAIESHTGYVFQIVGDAFCAAFSNALNAVAAALGVLRALRDEPWGETGVVATNLVRPRFDSDGTPNTIS